MRSIPLLRITLILGFVSAGAAFTQQKTASYADYVPVDPGTYCKRTFVWTLGPTGEVSSEIIGRLTVPYTSEPQSGAMVCNFFPGDGISVYSNDGIFVRTLMDGDHYPSTDCGLTAYPAGAVIGSTAIPDGLFLEVGSLNAVAVRKGLSECQVGGDSDDALWFRIHDVTARGQLYENALVIWNFDTGPFPAQLNLHGKDVEFGISAPTSAEPADPLKRAPHGFYIFGKGVGLVALGSIDHSGELVALAELASIFCEKQTARFDAFDVPGTQLTAAYGVNDAGDIVGHFRFAGDQPTHGFLRDKRAALTAIDFPGAAGTFARDINNRGEIVGLYYSQDNVAHGFRLSNGIFTGIDVPGALDTQADGLNDEGDVVGTYTADRERWHGFLLHAGVFSTIDYPGADSTFELGINARGEIAGTYYVDGARHGFLRSMGGFTPINVPGSRNTAARGISNAGSIVGYYTESDGIQRGFRLDKGVFHTILVPCARTTLLNDVTTAGDPVGHFSDEYGFLYGFRVRP